jgi:hypothetical protein
MPEKLDGNWRETKSEGTPVPDSSRSNDDPRGPFSRTWRRKNLRGTQNGTFTFCRIIVNVPFVLSDEQNVSRPFAAAVPCLERPRRPQSCFVATTNDRNCTHLAGEYFVAAELSKRGYSIGITMGNAKAIDVIAVSETNTAKIQVKAIASR